MTAFATTPAFAAELALYSPNLTLTNRPTNL
jgi:hypothetical protein